MSQSKPSPLPGQAGEVEESTHAPILLPLPIGVPEPILPADQAAGIRVERFARGNRVSEADLIELKSSKVWGSLVSAVLEAPDVPRRMETVAKWLESKGKRKTWLTIKAAMDAARLVVDNEPDELGPLRKLDLDLPLIVMGSESPDEGLKKWTPAALEAIRKGNLPPTLFQRSGELVRLQAGEDNPAPAIVNHNFASLRGHLDRLAIWCTMQRGNRGTVPRYGLPPAEVVSDLVALGVWDSGAIPHLDIIAESPRFLADGRLIVEPGYHPEARTFYAPPPNVQDIEIPVRPTPAEVDRARDFLLGEALVDFPFRNKASKANALALMLLPFVRMAIDGLTPFHMIEASTIGTGKSKLANACAFPAIGKPLVSTAQVFDEDEWRKTINSTLAAGPSHVFFDNLRNPANFKGVTHPIDSGVLALALTQAVWSARMLHTNDQSRLRINTVWMGTGNNIQWVDELSRRVVPISLLASEENPADRQGFRHNPLEAWLVANRRELLVACLILCRNWFARGCPAGSRSLASYENYARVMGGILEACGVEGFVSNQVRPGSSNQASARWPALVEVWWRIHGTKPTGVGQLHEMITGDGPAMGSGYPDLQEAFAEELSGPTAISQRQKLGHVLRDQKDQVWGDKRIVLSTAKGRGGALLYRLADRSEKVADNDLG